MSTTKPLFGGSHCLTASEYHSLQLCSTMHVMVPVAPFESVLVFQVPTSLLLPSSRVGKLVEVFLQFVLREGLQKDCDEASQTLLHKQPSSSILIGVWTLHLSDGNSNSSNKRQRHESTSEKRIRPLRRSHHTAARMVSCCIASELCTSRRVSHLEDVSVVVGGGATLLQRIFQEEAQDAGEQKDSGAPDEHSEGKPLEPLTISSSSIFNSVRNGVEDTLRWASGSLEVSDTVCTGCICGVHAIWVEDALRGRGIATAMLDSVRRNVVYGYSIPRDHVAFSSPTTDGRMLALEFTGRKDFLIF